MTDVHQQDLTAPPDRTAVTGRRRGRGEQPMVPGTAATHDGKPVLIKRAHHVAERLLHGGPDTTPSPGRQP
jgi:hypothetical protein